MNTRITALLLPLLLAACVAPPPEPPPPIPLISSQENVAARVLVTKSDHKLYLFDRAGMMMRAYDVSLGHTPEGPKVEEGDGKTPEGRYTIDSRNANSGYHLSLHISYPSPDDRANAKRLGVNPGGAIFIHGLPNDNGWKTWKYNKKNDWTDGCVAVADAEIREIWSLVPDGTPITITP